MCCEALNINGVNTPGGLQTVVQAMGDILVLTETHAEAHVQRTYEVSLKHIYFAWAHTPIPMSQRHSPPPHLATSRVPARATQIVLPHLKTLHKVQRLQRKVTISHHVPFNKICTTPHVWTA